MSLDDVPFAQFQVLIHAIVYRDGLFSYDGSPHYWLACLRTLPGGNPGTARTYRIYIASYENMERLDCEQVRLIIVGVGDREEGAFKYE